MTHRVSSLIKKFECISSEAKEFEHIPALLNELKQESHDNHLEECDEQSLNDTSVLTGMKLQHHLSLAEPLKFKLRSPSFSGISDSTLFDSQEEDELTLDKNDNFLTPQRQNIVNLLESPISPDSGRKNTLFSPNNSDYDTDEEGNELGNKSFNDTFELTKNNLSELNISLDSNAKPILLKTDVATVKPLIFFSDPKEEEEQPRLTAPEYIKINNVSEDALPQIFESLAHELIDSDIIKNTKGDSMNLSIQFNENNTKLQLVNTEEIKEDYKFVENIWKSQNISELECDKLLGNKNQNELHNKKIELSQKQLWDKFFKFYGSKLVKHNDNILFEFPDLLNAIQNCSTVSKIMDFGCGTGNDLFPILQDNENEQLRITGLDFSLKGLEILKKSNLYNWFSDIVQLEHCDITLDATSNFEASSVDIAILNYTLSAIKPQDWSNVLSNIHHVLKPQGKLLFKDYAKYDFAQLYLDSIQTSDEENSNITTHVKEDGTITHYFEEKEVESLFTQNNFFLIKICTTQRQLHNEQLDNCLHSSTLQAVFEASSA